MKTVIKIVLLVIIVPAVFYGQSPPAIAWQNTIGGADSDNFSVIKEVSVGGGYIIGGTSSSSTFGDKTDSLRGIFDYWIVKIDSGGVIEWDKTYGGSEGELLFSIDVTNDGGYILGGVSQSGISGDKIDSSRGGSDSWVIKVDSIGNIEWQKTLGGNQIDRVKVIISTNDGGYLLGCDSTSPISGEKTDSSRGGFDYWILKLNSTGNIQWQRTIGGDDFDILHDMKRTNDEGFILCGQSQSSASGEKSENSRGGYDHWIVKIDELGNIQWQKTIGGNDLDTPYSIQQTKDEGYVIAGESYSNISGDKTINTFGDDDYWIIKTDSLGNIQWQKTYGGNSFDAGRAVRQTMDGGYLIGGQSSSDSSGNKTDFLRGVVDYWIIKTDSVGDVEWQKTIGGSDFDLFYALEVLSDGSFIIGGESSSPISFEKTEDCIGMCYLDFWILKYSSLYTHVTNTPIDNLNFKVLPNPNNGSFQITYTPVSEYLHMQVFNILGEEVHNQLLPKWSQLQNISIANLPAGVYMATITISASKKSVKFVVE